VATTPVEDAARGEAGKPWQSLNLGFTKLELISIHKWPNRHHGI